MLHFRENVFRAVFIRAPAVLQMGSAVEELAHYTLTEQEKVCTLLLCMGVPEDLNHLTLTVSKVAPSPAKSLNFDLKHTGRMCGMIFE